MKKIISARRLNKVNGGTNARATLTGGGQDPRQHKPTVGQPVTISGSNSNPRNSK